MSIPKVVVSYYENAVAISDFYAEQWVDSMIKAHISAYGQSADVPTLVIAVSTINVVEVVRCLKRAGHIERLWLDWRGHSIEFDADARLNWPADFLDFHDRWAEQLV